MTSSNVPSITTSPRSLPAQVFNPRLRMLRTQLVVLISDATAEANEAFAARRPDIVHLQAYLMGLHATLAALDRTPELP